MSLGKLGVPQITLRLFPRVPIGGGNTLDKAIEKFAVHYADQVTVDYEKFCREIKRGRIRAAKDAAM